MGNNIRLTDAQIDQAVADTGRWWLAFGFELDLQDVAEIQKRKKDMNHTHTAKKTVTRCFTGSVSRNYNRAAHGGVCEHETCECGATRATNINGCHVEEGPWVEPDPESEQDAQR